MRSCWAGVSSVNGRETLAAFLTLSSLDCGRKTLGFWKGTFGLSDMGGNLLLLEFEFVDEAERVSKSRVRHFRGRSFCLERWNPFVGCLEGGGGARLVWVRILGLPLHLWGRNLFKPKLLRALPRPAKVPLLTWASVQL